MNVRSIPVLLALTLGVGASAFAQDTPAEQPKETQQQTIARLIKELGADGYETREAAQRQLEAIGRPAIAALEAASKSKDLEVASRAADALDAIKKTRRAPAEEAPAPERDPFRPPPPPDMDEVLKQLEKQMPEGFGKIFRQFFPNGQGPDPQGKPQPQDEERQGAPGGRSGVRSWTFTLGPDGRLRQPGEDTPRASQLSGLSALGFSTGSASAALRAQLEIRPGEGRVVNRLTKGGWAEEHGIKLYDVIVGIDGKPARQVKDLEPLLQKACKVEVFRRAKLQVLDLPKAGTVSKATPAPKVEKDGKGRTERSF